ncbi:MAG: lysophospholipid acyltransferase family protein [Steroidobacteraceae bacterium]|jgi:1-acyl-sn-glycerol-3-phosphate acyltransferase
MQYFRSLLFTGFMMITACLFGFVMGVCFWLPYRYQFAIARTWSRMTLWMLGVLCNLKFVVEGRENIPAGNHIVMCNHTSAWETMVHFLLIPAQVWVLKRELLWIPFVGWGLKLLKPIAINRGAGHRAVTQVVEQGKDRLAQGLWVIIFPEGTRVRAGQPKKYGVGGALLATETGKLVVPMSHNAGEFWARRGFLKKAGTIRLIIGKPVSPEGKDARQLNDAARAAIEAGLARIAAETTT